MLGAVALNRAWGLLASWKVILFVVVVVGGLLATKFATPYVMFPSKQHSTVYRDVGGVDGYLQPDDIVYVVEHNGVARAYPQRLIWRAHIFGVDYEEDVASPEGLTSVVANYVLRYVTPIRFSESRISHEGRSKRSSRVSF